MGGERASKAFMKYKGFACASLEKFPCKSVMFPKRCGSIFYERPTSETFTFNRCNDANAG